MALQIVISIHTVLADCDKRTFTKTRISADFNPHSPRRLWLGSANAYKTITLFQSTQSSQTVTWLLMGWNIIPAISIHTVLADCDLFRLFHSLLHNGISIHTVLADCDACMFHHPHCHVISIHTVLADCDAAIADILAQTEDFNPHSPRRLWHFTSSFWLVVSIFQSTQSSQTVTAIMHDIYY